MFAILDNVRKIDSRKGNSPVKDGPHLFVGIEEGTENDGCAVWFSDAVDTCVG